MIDDLIKTIRKTPHYGIHARVTNDLKEASVTKAGLFLKEASMNHIAHKYANYFKFEKDKQISENQALDEIINMAGKQLHYLDAKKFLWTGYVVPVNKWLVKRLRSSAGKVISCYDFLHHKDPMFEVHPNLKLLKHGENTAEFSIAGQTYKVPNVTFYFFVKKWRENEKRKSDNLRDCMSVLYRLFKKSQPEEDNPQHRRHRSWAFVLEDNVLKQCYKIKKKLMPD